LKKRERHRGQVPRPKHKVTFNWSLIKIEDILLFVLTSGNNKVINLEGFALKKRRKVYGG